MSVINTCNEARPRPDCPACAAGIDFGDAPAPTTAPVIPAELLAPAPARDPDEDDRTAAPVLLEAWAGLLLGFHWGAVLALVLLTLAMVGGGAWVFFTVQPLRWFFR